MENNCVHFSYTFRYTFMVTKVIGIKEFRQNMTKLYKQGQKNDICFIVMNHSVPVMKVEPLDEDELILEKFAKELAEARNQVERGEVYSTKEVRARLGL